MGNGVSSESEDEGGPAVETRGKVVKATGDVQEKFEFNKLANLFQDIGEVTDPQCHSLTSGEELNLISCYDSLVAWLTSRKQSGEPQITDVQLVDFLGGQQISEEFARRLFNAVDTDALGAVRVSDLLDFVKKGNWANYADLNAVVDRLDRTTLMPSAVDIFGDFDRSEVECHADQIFKYLRQQIPVAAEFIEFPYNLHDNLVDLRLRLLKKWYQTAKTFEAMNSEQQNAKGPSEGKMFLKPPELCYSELLVSSNNSDVGLLTDLNPTTYWQSDGQARSHFIRAKIKKGVIITAVHIGVNSTDSSYMPKTIGVSVGKTSSSATSELYRVAIPSSTNGEIQLLKHPLDQYYAFLQLNILACYSDGCDCRVRSLRFEGYRFSQSKAAKTPDLLVDRGFSWYLDILTSTVEACSSVAPSLRHAVMRHTLTALKDLEPLALCRSKINSVVSPRMLEKMQKFIENVGFGATDSPLEWKITALETFIRLAVCTGSVATTLKVALFALSNFNKEEADMITSDLMKFIHDSRRKVLVSLFEEHCKEDGDHAGLKLNDSNCVRNLLHDLVNLFVLICSDDDHVDYSGITVKLIIDSCDKVFSETDDDKINQLSITLLQSHFLDLVGIVISKGKVLADSEWGDKLFRMLVKLLKQGGSAVLSASVFKTLMSSAEICIPGEHTRREKLKEMLSSGSDPLLFGPVGESDPESLQFFSLCRYWTAQPLCHLFNDEEMWLEYLQRTFKLVTQRMLSRINKGPLNCPLEDARDEVFFAMVNSHLFSAVSRLEKSGSDAKLVCLMQIAVENLVFVLKSLGSLPNEQLNNLTTTDVTLGGLLTPLLTFGLGLFDRLKKGVPKYIWLPLIRGLVENRNCMKLLSNVTFDELMAKAMDAEPLEWFMTVTVQSDHPYSRHSFESKLLEAYGGRKFEVTFDDESELADGSSLEIITTTGSTRKFKGKMGNDGWPKTVTFYSCDRLIFRLISTEPNVSWGYKCSVSATPEKGAVKQFSWQSDLVLTLIKVLGKLIGSCVTESQSHFPHGHSQKDKRHHLVQTIFKNGKMKKISDELANLFNVGDDLLSEDKIHMVESAVADCELKTKVSAAMLNDDLAKRCFYGIFGAVYWYLDPVSLSSDPTNKSEPSEALLQMYVDCVGAMKKILRKRQDLVKSDEIATNDEPSVEDQPGQKYLEGCLDRAKILFKFQSTESPPADVTQTNFNSPITAAKKRFSRSISGRRRTVSIEENFQQHPYSPSVSAQIRPLLNFIVDDVVTAGEVEIWFREEQDSRDAAESGWKAIEEYLVATNFLEANVRSEYVGVLFLRELLQGTSVAIPRDNTNVLKVITMMAEKLTQTPSENLNEREALLFRQHREFLRVALLRIVATMTTGPVDQLLPIVLKYLVSSTVGEEVVADHQSLWTCSDKRLAIKHYTDAFAMLLCTAMMSKLAVETQKGSVEPHLLTNAIHLVTEQLALNTSLVRDYEEIRVEQRRLGLVAIAARSLKGSALELIVFTCVKFLKTGLLCGSRNDFLVGTILGKSLQRCSPQLADSICNQTSVTPVEGIAAGHLSLQFLFTFGCESLGQKDPQWPSLIVQIIQQLGRNDVWRLAVTEYLNEKVKTVLRIVLQSATTAVDDVHSAVFTLMCLCGFPNAPCPGKRVEFLDCDEWKKGVLVKLIAETGSATVVDVRKRVERSCKAKEYRCVSETPILTGTVEWPLLLEVLEKLSSGFAAKEPHCSNLPELLALYRDVLVFKSMKLFAAETLSTNKESLEDLYNPETLASLVKVAGRRTSFHVGCQLSQLEVLSLGILSLKAGADGTHLGDGLNELIADHEESPASVSDGGTITDPTVGPPGDEVVVNTAADDVDTDSEVDRVGPVVLVDPYWDMDIGGGHATNTLQAAIGAAAMWLNYLFGEEEKPESRRSQKQRNSLLGIRDPGLRIPSLSVFCHTLPSGGEIVRRLEQQFNEETSTGCSRCLYGLFEDHSDDCKQLDFTEEAAEHDEDLSSYAYCHKDGPTTAVKPTGTSAGFSCAVLQSHLILIARELLSIMLSHWPLDMSLWPEKFDLSGWDSFAALLDLIRTTNADGFKATLARVFEVGLKQTYLSDPSEFLQNMTTVGGEFILESSFHRREKLEFAKTGGTAEPVHVHLPSATFCAITIEGFSGGKLVLATSEDLIAHRMELTGKKTKEKVEGIVIEGKDIWLQYTSPNTSRAGVVTVTVESHVVGRLNVGLELLSLSLRTLEMGDVNLVNSIRLDDLVFQLVTAATYSVGDRQLTVIGLLVKVITFLLDFTGDIAKKPNLQHFVALWCILDATEKFAGQSEQHTTVKPSLSRALTELLFLVENLSIKWNQQNELAAELVPTAPVFKCFAQGIGTIAFIAAAIEYDCKAATLWSSFVEDGKVPIPDFP